MPTSNYMPDVVVEIAFNAGYTTPAASRVWTDVSAYVELDRLIEIGRGRADERSTADPNWLNLALDNRDGRFTPGLASSPYYPNVKLYRPIRVTATPPGGVASVRFLGYVTEWPTTWDDGTDATAYTRLKALSRLSRLGNTTNLRSILEQEILADGPYGYYTLGDSSKSTTASDSSGNGRPALRTTGTGTAFTFGQANGPAGDGLTAAQFAGGLYLAGAVPSLGLQTFECWVLRNGTSGGPQTVSSNNVIGDLLIMFGGGTMVWRTSLVLQSVTNCADGRWHHVAVTDDGVTLTMYIDGVLEDSRASIGIATIDQLAVGGTTASGSFNFQGSVAHVAISPAVLSATRIAARAATLQPETTAARLTRLAGYAGIPAAEVDAGGAATLVGTQATSDRKVLQAMRDVEESEAGVLFDARDGTLTLHPRSKRYAATVGLTLDMATQQVGYDYEAGFDPTLLINDAEIAGPTVAARVVDTVSVGDYGQADGSGSTLATNDDEPLMLAGWRVNPNSQPRGRVPKLTVDVLTCGVSPGTIAAVDVGTLIQLNGQPSQAAAASRQVFAEGYEETFGPESWVMQFNATPAEPSAVWQLDSATRSQLGTSTLLAL